MTEKTSYRDRQAKFYDQRPPLVPWPELLGESGLSYLYKPREIFWKKAVDDLRIGKGEKILDVGCGQGLFLARLARTHRVRGVGIDVSGRSIQEAEKNWGTKDLVFQEGDATKIPYPDASFDRVVSFDTLEHIGDQKRAVQEMVRVLRPGGRLLVYTLNKNDRFTLDWWWEKLGLDIYSRAAHQRELFVDPGWLRQELEAGRAKVDRLSFFDAFFTLGLDEAIMVGVLVCQKLGLFKSRFLGKAFLFVGNWVSRILFPICQVLDWPWYRQGHSLSFVIIAEKLEK